MKEMGKDDNNSWIAGIIYIAVVLAVIAWMFLCEHSFTVWNVEEGLLPPFP